MKKADREKVFNKYGGRCAYCGCELGKGWHIDEIEPVKRGWRYIRDDKGERVWDPVKFDYVKENTIDHPERFHIDNQNPACASCNINKHSDSLEVFRANIEAYIASLNRYTTTYKIAKRYGLVQETGNKVVFYFETLTDHKGR